MPDLTMCSPTKWTKKCNTCYRMTAKPDKWQSYSNLQPECSKYYIETMSPVEYNKRMDRIIKQGGMSKITDTLIALLEEASKYHIEESEIVKPGLSKQKKGKHERSHKH